MTSRLLQQLGVRLSEFKTQLEKLPLEHRIWLHAVSVGELNAARPLIMALREKGHPIVISTTTKTGQALAKKTYPDLPVCFFPLDFPWVVSSALDEIRPEKILIMETEIWPGFMNETHRRKIPVYLINGRMSDKSFAGYARFKCLFKPVLQKYTKLLMQTESDKARIVELGAPPDKVSIIGNLKFDTASHDNSEEIQQLRQLFDFAPGTQTLVFASTHPGEDELFLQLYQQMHPTFHDMQVILAPRHPERIPAVAKLIEKMGMRCILRSQLPLQTDTSSVEEGISITEAVTRSLQMQAMPKVYLLDTIGELRTVFGFSTLAVMGGSFVPIGGHNPLEPIQMGIPVLFGPHMENFRDIARMVCETRAGAQLQSIENAYPAIHWLLSDMHSYEDMVVAGKTLIETNQGATQRILEALEASQPSHHTGKCCC